jgi:asparagine synthase (glutamine-hydrolysing)
MAFGIEARVPFLDHRLVEAAARLPDRLKVDGSDRKVGLRRAIADLLPPSILGRRDKIGFETPEARWLQEQLPELRTVVAPAVSEGLGLLRRGAVSQAFDAWGGGRLPRGSYWRILNLELWAQDVRKAPD